jgi:hypothetical protein
MREISIRREVFSYSARGRRDPMISLITSADLRPMFTEIELVGITYDEEGRNSVALFRNIEDKKNTMYRVKLGQQLGRMKVTQITRREVVLTLDEFGFSRQERMSIKPDTTRARSQ